MGKTTLFLETSKYHPYLFRGHPWLAPFHNHWAPGPALADLPLQDWVGGTHKVSKLRNCIARKTCWWFFTNPFEKICPSNWVKIFPKIRVKFWKKYVSCHPTRKVSEQFHSLRISGSPNHRWPEIAVIFFRVTFLGSYVTSDQRSCETGHLEE